MKNNAVILKNLVTNLDTKYKHYLYDSMIKRLFCPSLLDSRGITLKGNNVVCCFKRHYHERICCDSCQNTVYQNKFVI